MTDEAIARRVLLLGVTDYAAVFIDTFEGVPGLSIEGCVQNQSPAGALPDILGRPVHWTGDIDCYRETHHLLCVLATTRRRDWIDELAARGHRFAVAVHPSAVVSARARVAPGASIDAGGIVSAFSEIGPHARLGRRVSIGHHTRIGAYSTVHPGATVSGLCELGEAVTVGTGAIIVDRVTVGAGAVISAGAVVTRAVPPRALVAGNPARIVRQDYGPK